MPAGDLRSQISRAAFAFRGYNVTNLGRTPELLAHPRFGPVVDAALREASQIATDVLKRPVDLSARVREQRETRGLEDYAEDVAFIVAVELAQLRLLDQFFGITLPQAKLAFGYSLGECTALIAAGVYDLPGMLPIPLAMAPDCAALAADVTLGILFSRGSVIDFELVRRLCMEVTQQGDGVIDVSTQLSPNSLLLMGQNGILSTFEKRIREVSPQPVYVRRHQHCYPPLHTPIMWQRNIPNRTARMLQTAPGGFRAPSLPLMSMVTGAASYNATNSRELMHRWVDHPQRMWDIMYRVLVAGVETIVHVGPAPNLLPATFKRLASNVTAQVQSRSLGGLGSRTLSLLVRRPWLNRLLPESTALLRAPYVQHVVLEDWLLDQSPHE